MHWVVNSNFQVPLTRLDQPLNRTAVPRCPTVVLPVCQYRGVSEGGAEHVAIRRLRTTQCPEITERAESTLFTTSHEGRGRSAAITAIVDKIVRTIVRTISPGQSLWGDHHTGL
ncbi:hypothetical protein DPEC_G00183180 [Dallia pectoralis]|uniref:Uncharacterized protein n=1 Tax=Dallia pectoralis TaxID=75939 RepID=A0ACC2GB25_DALPE|nr:hypothetical protein DPEC_G00183180 [Dallia pectoralis]